MPEVIIRKAQLEDISILKEFEQGVILAERPYDETLDVDPISYYDLEVLINSADAEVLVAEDSERIVGSGYAKILEAKPYLNHDRYAYLGFMYVLPSHRGVGVNKLIVDDLLAWAKGRGLVEARLDVYDENEAALRAYKKVGFKGHLLNMRIGL